MWCDTCAPDTDDPTGGAVDLDDIQRMRDEAENAS